MSKKLKILIPTLLILATIYSTCWFIFAGQAKNKMKDRIQDVKNKYSEFLSISYSKPVVKGFPFNFRPTVAEFKVTTKNTDFPTVTYEGELQATSKTLTLSGITKIQEKNESLLTLTGPITITKDKEIHFIQTDGTLMTVNNGIEDSTHYRKLEGQISNHGNKKIILLKFHDMNLSNRNVTFPLKNYSTLTQCLTPQAGKTNMQVEIEFNKELLNIPNYTPFAQESHLKLSINADNNELGSFSMLLGVDVKTDLSSHIIFDLEYAQKQSLGKHLKENITVLAAHPEHLQIDPEADEMIHKIFSTLSENPAYIQKFSDLLYPQSPRRFSFDIQTTSLLYQPKLLVHNFSLHTKTGNLELTGQAHLNDSNPEGEFKLKITHLNAICKELATQINTWWHFYTLITEDSAPPPIIIPNELAEMAPLLLANYASEKNLEQDSLTFDIELEQDKVKVGDQDITNIVIQLIENITGLVPHAKIH